MGMLGGLMFGLARGVLGLRYRVKVLGEPRELQDVKGALILPNHPAYMDPPLVITTLSAKLKPPPRPMLLARIFENPLLFWLPQALNAVRVPDLTRPSVAARRETEAAIAEIVEGLQRGENFIIWPAGRAQRNGTEQLGSARAVSEILARAPGARVVLVRTRGLWGSMFSYGRTGSAPNLTKRLLQGIAILAANLLFLTPKRDVEITVEPMDRAKLPDDRDQLNRFLEEWYNRLGPEQPSHVPYHFLFGSREFEFPTAEAKSTETDDAPPDVRQAVQEVIGQKLNRRIEPDEYQPGARLADLGLDSLDAMEVALTIEQQFGTPGEQVPVTVGDLWAIAQGTGDAAHPAAPHPAPKTWSRPASGDLKLALPGSTIREVFVEQALRHRRDIAAADDLSGVLTYERMLVAALAMAARLRRISAPNVGLMLPASVAADIALFALHLAGKLPVLLNWTTGPAGLAHAVKLMGLTHVVTSGKFLDRTGIEIPGVEPVLLEDLRGEIGKLELLRTLLRVRFSPGSIRGNVPQAGEDDPAVVLFTSGSEKAPKAVPLTHRNLLSNIQSVFDGYTELTRNEAMLSFLPPFHSFGLTVTSLLPLLGGCRVVHHPDPTAGRALARKIAAYRPTILCATPSFLSGILDRSEPADLTSLRMVVVGGEKCPPALFDRFEQMAPQAKLVEGYGVTECAPLISGNRMDEIRRGSIGRPLPGVEVMTIDPDTLAPQPPGTLGLLLVHSPSVFPGYIGEDAPSPFIEQGGKRWYNTADLVRIDEAGIIWFQGRLKRFVKAGGEMISLPALEEPLAQRYPPKSPEDGPRVAVEGTELPGAGGGRRIVLFTVEDVTLQQANAILHEHGYRGVMRIDEVRRVEAIPTLGTGKTDYKVLRRQITE